MQAQKREYKKWTQSEHDMFKKCYDTYKKSFDSYMPHLEGRSKLEIKSFFYNEAKRRRLIERRKQSDDDIQYGDLLEMLKGILVSDSEK